MLETILSNINSNLERIANYLDNRKENAKPITNAQEPVETPIVQHQSVTNPIPTPTPIPTANQTNVQSATVSTQQIQVPISQTVESFTREQIAVALSHAVAAGRRDIIQTVFNTFKANSLMELKPENYGQVATMLREAGFQV